MTKKWVAFASVLLLSGTAAVAGGWADGFKTLDTDGSGTVAQTEYNANVGKLKIDPVPQFSPMDKNGTGSIDADEWTAAEKMVNAFPVSCKSSSEFWVSEGVLTLGLYDLPRNPAGNFRVSGDAAAALL